MRAPEFWQRRGMPATLLRPAGKAYTLAGLLRHRLVATRKARVPVICVGNVVAGGAGKTPVVLSLLERLTARGIGAHAILRGYGGDLEGPIRVEPGFHSARQVGDEALLLAGGAPTWVARDRVQGAESATAAGARCLVLDDGLQNPSLHKDLSFLVVDGAIGVGNGFVIPAGPLREPVGRALARASAVVMLGEDRHGLSQRLGEGRPLLRGALVPVTRDDGLRGRRVIAFAGIGRPEKFFATLAGTGAQVLETHAFADHHRYRPEELEALHAAAARRAARLVTTEKDAVRLPPADRARVSVLPVRVEWERPDELDRLVQRVIADDR